MICRHCKTPLENVFLDLAFSPPSNSYVTEANLTSAESYFPLKLYVCNSCWLVQTIDYTCASDLFNSDYAYFSSVSASWLKHAEKFARDITQRIGLDQDSHVIEIASNDGYLLKNFVAAGIPCLGIEPTDSTAAAAEKLGVPVLREFFGEQLARQLCEDGKQADLIVGNNVYAHVPDINDFTAGMKLALKAGGTISLEFPHLLSLIDKNQFDTVYHEHFSYLSLTTVSRIMESCALRVIDVEKLSTHGGSLRVYAAHADDGRATSLAVTALLSEEEAFGMRDLQKYLAFQEQADAVKNGLLEFLLEQKRLGKSVAAYGAAAKGCTLLNYAGVKRDLLPYVCDAAPSKQGKYLPGTHIPILHPDVLQERKPDFVLILPWNIADEVMSQQQQVQSWGGKFVVAIPELRVF